MLHAREATRCAEELDVVTTRRLWAEIFPHLPAPTNDAKTLAFLHAARTQMRHMKFDLRAYSHAWLCERGYPSMLPDNMRRRAERLYPVVLSAVGISVNSAHEEVRRGILTAMEYAVLEAEADGKLTDSPHVKRRMMQARERERLALFGRIRCR
jgi:hypothetical protein